MQGRGAARHIDVLAAGETMAMVVPSEPIALARAAGFEMHAGGAESNVAMHLASLGRRTAWAGRLGADPIGDRVADALLAAGVLPGPIERDTVARTGVYFKDPAQGRTAVHYYRDGSAASFMDASFADRLPVGDARVLHLTGITPALSETCAEFVRVAARRAHDAGTMLSIDVNYRPALWSPQQAAPVLLRLTAEADILFVGLDEAAVLWGIRTADEVRELLAAPAELVVKDGATGATAFTSTGRHHVPSPVVQVREVVGAGDAFAAGYLDGVLDGAASLQSLDRGHARAAHAMVRMSDV